MNFPVPEGYYDGVNEEDKPHYQAIIDALDTAEVTDPVEAATQINAMLSGTGIAPGASESALIRHVWAPSKLVKLLVAGIKANPDQAFVDQALAKINEARQEALRELRMGVFKKIGG
ncbi:hypothetical protein A2706_02520 [Candidatus Peribacteria bacterium RIFCSPHIGHO2_01_FULL_51_35]|nr:MAG: hypothetical protein A2706_02520 [Candidatus Peribacteria bacterium RIFCSPHIGHO2_01_FULL_51_35]